MWRFFRFGVKGSNIYENNIHFRIIGTTSANAECEDKPEEESDSVWNKENIAKESLASRASRDYHPNRAFVKHEVFSPKYNISNNLPNNIKNSPQNLKLVTNDSGSSKKDSCDTKTDDKGEGKDAKIFGTLCVDQNKFENIPDDPDDQCISPWELYGQRLDAHSYGRKILTLCQERKLKEALAVLDVEMRAQKVFPNEYCYNILINACGKVGYTEKAFKLYKEMKGRGLKVEKFALTGLFNAVANSPEAPSERLSRATTLRKSLKDNQVALSPITYHAMIKAFGRCGDIESAFEIADEMLIEEHVLTTETMNFLLQSCLSDKESGFRHALMVWRKMRSLDLTPCIYSYNLLLRCTKECSAGDANLVAGLLRDLQDEEKERFGRKLKKYKRLFSKKYSPGVLRIPKTGTSDREQIETEPSISGIGTHSHAPNSSLSNQETVTLDQREKDQSSITQIDCHNRMVSVQLDKDMELEVVSPVDSLLNGRIIKSPNDRITGAPNQDILPDVLTKNLHQGNVIFVTSLDQKHGRLSLLGGVHGVLENMMKDGVQPNTATFIAILESLPESKAVEDSLICSMSSCVVVPNIVFCNKLIRRRCLSRGIDEAKEVLDLMQKHHVNLDLISFGCFAIGCKRPSDCSTLLRDMKKAGFNPNEEIICTLMRNCLRSREYLGAIELLKELRVYGMEATKDILRLLEKGRASAKQQLINQEMREESTTLSPRHIRKREEAKLFLMEYNHWLRSSKLEQKDHPWAQFGYRGNDEGGGKIVSSLINS